MFKEETANISQDTILLIAYSVIVIFSLLVFVIGFFILYQKRKNKFLLAQLEAQRIFEEEIASSRVEIQEQTFKNIAWELHDNVGQLLSVINIQLNMVLHKVPKEYEAPLTETKDLVAKTIKEVRSLSKTLNTDVIKQNGLIASIQTEITRFNRLGFIDATLTVLGDEKPLEAKDEIILFRIIQEFLSNVIKHAKADKLIVSLHYKDAFLDIKAEDNGVGFNVNQKQSSSGMHTMKERAKLLRATYKLESEIGVGTRLLIEYPYKK
jgi:hypothetical protein